MFEFEKNWCAVAQYPCPDLIRFLGGPGQRLMSSRSKDLIGLSVLGFVPKLRYMCPIPPKALIEYQPVNLYETILGVPYANHCLHCMVDLINL